MSKYAAFIKPLLISLMTIAACIILYYGKNFLIPIAYGAMFAFLVNPLDQKLRRFGLNKYLTAILSISAIVLVIFILLSVFGWQIQQLSEQKQQIKKELVNTQEKIQDFTKNQFGISLGTQEQYAEKLVNKLEENASRFVGNTLSTISTFFLSLIYAILLLGEKKRIQEFMYKIFKSEDKAEDTIAETAEVTQSYLIGKLIIIAILSVIYAIGFSILGIKYAVLIAVLAALLTFIPYIGNIIGGLLAVLITLATGGSMTDILVIIAIMSVAQIVESYILEPWIVGSHVDLNPLFSIIAVIGFGILWGAAGAIIALPLAGILRIIFDHLPAYRPMAFLMGTDKED